MIGVPAVDFLDDVRTLAAERGLELAVLEVVHEKPTVRIVSSSGMQEVHGIEWCVVHEGVADECNDGTICDMRQPGDQPCDLHPMFIRIPLPPVDPSPTAPDWDQLSLLGAEGTPSDQPGGAS